MGRVKHKKGKRSGVGGGATKRASEASASAGRPASLAVAQPPGASEVQSRAAAASPEETLSAMETADWLHSAAIHLLRKLRIRDRESGIGPAQLSALSVLVFGGPRSLGELADAEQVRPPTMTRIAAGLERAGLVRRHDTEDGRRVRLEATAKGTKIMWEGRKRRVESLARVVGAMAEGERKQLRAAIPLLQQLIRGI